MIYQNSRYYSQYVDYVSFTENGDELPIVFYEFDTLGRTEWFEHVVKADDRLDTIAHDYYGRTDVWWLIPEYNPEIVDFANIAPGTVIRIPNV